MTLEEAFCREAEKNAQTAMLAHGAPTKRLLLALEQSGLEPVRESARRHRVSDGFDHLSRLGHLELTPEALMTKGKYGALFTDDEVNWALNVLMEAGYFG